MPSNWRCLSARVSLDQISCRNIHLSHCVSQGEVLTSILFLLFIDMFWPKSVSAALYITTWYYIVQQSICHNNYIYNITSSEKHNCMCWGMMCHDQQREIAHHIGLLKVHDSTRVPVRAWNTAQMGTTGSSSTYNSRRVAIRPKLLVHLKTNKQSLFTLSSKMYQDGQYLTDWMWWGHTWSP